MDTLIASLIALATVLFFCGLALTIALFLILCEGPGVTLIEYMLHQWHRWKP